MPALIVAAALLVAAWLYCQFLTCHRCLWDSGAHDRNAHYLTSLKMAIAVRHGRLFEFLHEVERARIWPPLHALLAAAALSCGGLDYRLAVLPSLAAWLGLVLLAFLLARHAAGRGGTLAGLLAALLVLVSPAHRAFATDIMLESLGACLMMLVILCYCRAVDVADKSLWPGRLLGLALTALFLEKYNYWLLAVLTLLLTELLTRPRAYVGAARAAIVAVDWRRWGRVQLRRPLAWVLTLLLALTAGAAIRGEPELVVAGQAITVYPPENLIHAAYVVLFALLAGWWRTGLRDWVGGVEPRWRQVVSWHVWPAACWLLLPKHPAAFLWYLSPANASATQHCDLGVGLREYGRWAVDDYHAAPWMAGLTLAMFGVALLNWRRLHIGGRAAVCLACLAAALCVFHPNRMARNLHPWVTGCWVAAGVGLAMVLYGRLAGRWPRIRRALVAGLVAALACPHLMAPPHAQQGGPHRNAACFLDLADNYLAELRQSDRVAILAAVPVQSLAEWTFLQRFECFDGLEQHWYGFGPPGKANREGFRRWLAATSCDTLVCYERIPGFPTLEGGLWERHAELSSLLRNQREFRLVREQAFPNHGCRILVWRR